MRTRLGILAVVCFSTTTDLKAMPFKETRPRGPTGDIVGSPGPVYNSNPKIYRKGQDGTIDQSLYSGLKQGYTRPRRPLCGMYTSPNAGILLGLKVTSFKETRPVGDPIGDKFGSPAPVYNVVSKYYRKGQDDTPPYSLYSRPKEVFFKNSPFHAYVSVAYKARHHADAQPGSDKHTDAPEVTKTGKKGGKQQHPSIAILERSKIGGFYEDLAKINH